MFFRRMFISCYLQCLRDGYTHEHCRDACRIVHDIERFRVRTVFSVISIVVGICFLAWPDITLPAAGYLIGGGLVASGVGVFAVRAQLPDDLRVVAPVARPGVEP